MRPFLTLFSVALLSLPSAFAQSPPQAQPETPTFQMSARDVIVDVVVTNDKGEPVKGLKASDFQVLEDGKPQKVDFFEGHNAKALPPGALAPLPQMPPNVYTNVPPAPPSDAVNVLMLDMLNTPEQNFAYSREQLMEFLKNVKPGTRMAIVTLADKVNIVTGFTADVSTLLAALSDAKKGQQGQVSQSLVTRSDEAAQNSSIAFQRSSNVGQSTASIQALQSAYQTQSDFAQRNRTLMTLEALRHLAKFLGNVPGRKNLLWFSSDFPVSLLPNLSERGANDYNLIPNSIVRKTADELTAARVAVYPIQAQGIMNDSWFLADSGGAGNTPTYTGSAGAPNLANANNAIVGDTLRSDASARANILAEMNQLAADTGGKAFYNNNDLSTATARAIADGSDYYALTYSPSNQKLDGKYRKIDIRLPDTKYHLSWRRGYNADPITVGAAAKAEADPLHPLMLLGTPNSTEILYGLRVLPAAQQPAPNAAIAGHNSKLKGPVRRLSVDFMIRWTDINLTPGPNDSHGGRVQVELLAYSSDGQALNWNGGTEVMQMAPQTYAAVQKSGIPAHIEIDVPQDQPVILSSGVYDLSTGKVGTLQIPLQPGTAHAAASAPAVPGATKP
ncbi:VWA domain-containing protein [Occallatibacter riparius]|uniref:VWA domain-containing protein n=1 Tax=Occallatibacter riparius TaxID=1002689 RepID=A0A9J7BNU6_9BACT|nr:VWA domain-containing protein [Occallatibacter riparius]UWZ84193.1 VWA domain-containing protein [Occallatibacter riparius]